MIQRIILCLCVILMVSCGLQPTNNAPVENLSEIPQNVYIVHKGDSLYSIAFQYDIDYRHLARLNHIKSPYTINKGQIIYLSNPPSTHLRAKTAAKKNPSRRNYSRKWVSNRQRFRKKHYQKIKKWQWPAKGAVIEGFHLTKPTNAGINIAGRLNAPVRAAAKGEVVYSGHGIFGYGNLIILKHNQTYLTAYAHNRQNLVKEGQRIKQGQLIARMGRSNSRRVMLHFEVRKAGKPVNPLHYLPKAG